MSLENFTEQSLQLFRHQYRHSPVYRRWVDLLGVDPDSVDSLEKIPYLPIDAFRFHEIHTADKTPELIFSSSGTTGLDTARHFVSDQRLYLKSLLEGFRQVYGEPSDWTFLFLLPSYLDRESGQSSLVWMARALLDAAGPGPAESRGFYLDDFKALSEAARKSIDAGKKTMLLGVSFALLDLAESNLWDNSLSRGELAVVETGGMKGRKREIVREELHERLCAGLGVDSIQAEYGMTELLSQAWSPGQGRYRAPAWMKVSLRELQDPLVVAQPGSIGGLNVIDLANANSCAFLATNDLARIHPDGTFEVLGRFDHAVVRGCSLMLPNHG